MAASGYFWLWLLLMYSYWIPQIIANARRDSRRALYPPYLWGTTLLRLAIPAYFLGCPRNVLIVIEPKYTLLIVLCIWVMFQVVVLWLQDIWGPRFFVPKRFLPEKYDYYRVVDLTRIANNEDCAICMSAITYETGRRRMNRNEYMVTPCNHVFHPTCLQRWMEIKMQCPICRQTIPGYE